MESIEDKINTLDTSLFEAILSQTTDGDRRSLLAVQRAAAKAFGEFSCLEIGSYLGGTIQPFLMDGRCKKIYSIDPRPQLLEDDRAPGMALTYKDNTLEKMMSLLAGIGAGDVSKIENLVSDASEVDPTVIDPRPEVLFIDGEHTHAATVSDFNVCLKVASPKGAILFHDFGIVYPALVDICEKLDEEGRDYVAVKLESQVFGIFLDPSMVEADAFIKTCQEQNPEPLKSYKRIHQLKLFIRKPGPNQIRLFLNKLRNKGVRSTMDVWKFEGMGSTDKDSSSRPPSS